jgi:hypothetical protein
MKLVVQETIFTVYFGKETDFLSPLKYSNLPSLIKSQDCYFRSGFSGLFTDGSMGVFFDSF